MLRLCSAFCFLILLSNGLYAQAPAQEQPSSRQLSPEAASFQKEVAEVADFARKLESLKKAFAANEAGKIVAYEAHLKLAIRTEMEQASISGKSAQEAKMAQLLTELEGTVFDPNKPETAANGLLKLEGFLQLMQEELQALHNSRQ